MYAHVRKPKESKSRAVANAVVQKKTNGKQGFGFVDNRPEVIIQKNLQELANNSLQAKQAAQIQATANNCTIQMNSPKNSAFKSNTLQLRQIDKDTYEPLRRAHSYEPQFAKHISEISDYGQEQSEIDGAHTNTVIDMDRADLRDEIRRNLLSWTQDWLLVDGEQGLETTDSYTYTEWYDGEATAGAAKKHRFKARTSDVDGRDVLKAYHYQG